jgi:uncharacterized protein
MGAKSVGPPGRAVTGSAPRGRREPLARGAVGPDAAAPVLAHNHVFRAWLALVLVAWVALASERLDVAFALDHWFYPAVMVVGAFFAGSTPQGGGAVAFPVLSVFLDVEWTAARDFSLMVQSVGMTSASVFLLTRPGVDRSVYRPLLWWVPTAAFGFVVGMLWLQQARGIVVQGIFVGFITAFAAAYLRSDHRGVRDASSPRRLSRGAEASPRACSAPAATS